MFGYKPFLHVVMQCQEMCTHKSFVVTDSCYVICYISCYIVILILVILWAEETVKSPLNSCPLPLTPMKLY